MTRDELVEQLALLLAGLQVPLSITGLALGAGEEPYRKILADRGFGWSNADEFRAYLTDRLALT